MKVLHVLHELKFSGAEIMYVDAAPKLRELGCELLVVNTTEHLGEYASHFEDAGYKVLHWPYPKDVIGRWKYYSKVVRFLKRERIDVVHIHDTGLKWGMSYCAWRAGIKVVYTFHSCFPTRWFSKPYHLYLRWVAKYAFGCKFQSISDAVYENELKVFHNPTTLIYNWYGKRRFFPDRGGEKQQIRQKLDIPADSLVLVSVGGCSPIKRHDEILKAIPIILRKYPNTVYLHLGSGVSLAEEMSLARDFGISHYVRFCGNQDNVRDYLVAADIYLMTSRFEGISLTTIESMACGIPAILYNVPGLRDFNKRGCCSLLIEESPEKLANAVCCLYADAGLRQELCRNAKQLVGSLYDLDKNVESIFRLYND